MGVVAVRDEKYGHELTDVPRNLMFGMGVAAVEDEGYDHGLSGVSRDHL